MSDEGDKRRSDTPSELVRDREAFVRSLLKRGFELTEELLAENGELRSEIDRVREENARLRAAVASGDAIRDLLSRIDALEAEKRELLARSDPRTAPRRFDDERLDEIERQLNDLANVYIASFQLHTTLTPRRVLRHLLDMCGQLVGGRSFVVYLLGEDGRRAMPVGWEGLGAATPDPILVGEGEVGEACLTGIATQKDPPRGGTLASPVAVIPIVVEGRSVGAIAIVELLAQKQAWAEVDRELFKLLGAHAGTALIAANLYAAVGTPLRAFAGIEENLRKGAPPQGEGG